MPGHRATAIANEFIKRAQRDDIPVTQMKLQKLAFLANGWNWVVNETRLISDTPYAWKFGPVYSSLYEHSKLFGKRAIERLITPDDKDELLFFGVLEGKSKPFQADLDTRESSVLDQVWAKYGPLDAYTLSGLTHSEQTPWNEAYYGKGPRSRIQQKNIARHYQELAEGVTA